MRAEALEEQLGLDVSSPGEPTDLPPCPHCGRGYVRVTLDDGPPLYRCSCRVMTYKDLVGGVSILSVPGAGGSPPRLT